jgi:biopolymer transport protein ExbD
MAGVSVDGGTGKRRSLDSEINMIPMIDLLMVTVSFLLITAVWAHSQRLTADAQVPGTTTEPLPCDGCRPETKLHVQTADPGKFVLAWKQGATVLRTVDVPRDGAKPGRGQLRTLAAKIDDEWRGTGVHREPSDRSFDRAVVHAANDMLYSELIAVMDAVAQPKRVVLAGGKHVETSAFDVTFAME